MWLRKCLKISKKGSYTRYLVNICFSWSLTLYVLCLNFVLLCTITFRVGMKVNSSVERGDGRGTGTKEGTGHCYRISRTFSLNMHTNIYKKLGFLMWNIFKSAENKPLKISFFSTLHFIICVRLCLGFNNRTLRLLPQSAEESRIPMNT